MGITARDVPNVFYRTYRRTSEALHLLDTAPPGTASRTTDCVHQLAPASSLVGLQRLSGDRVGGEITLPAQDCVDLEQRRNSASARENPPETSCIHGEPAEPFVVCLRRLSGDRVGGAITLGNCNYLKITGFLRWLTALRMDEARGTCARNRPRSRGSRHSRPARAERSGRCFRRPAAPPFRAARGSKIGLCSARGERPAETG